MTVGLVGVDHTRAPLPVRESVAVEGERYERLLELLARDSLIDESAVLATCNRVEVYVAAADVETALDRAAGHLATATGVSSAELNPLLAHHVEADAARHLFAVAAGLRSLVVGESQILAQVGEAFAAAGQRELAGAELQRLARSAVQCGKRVRTETRLGTADTSVSAVAVAAAQRRLGRLRDRAALLIGAGRINEVSAQALREAGIGSLTIVSRTYEAAAEVASRWGGTAAALDYLAQRVAAADLVITATRAPRPLVVAETVLPRTADRPLLIYDLAVPRDVEPAVGALAHVELTDLESLRAVIPAGAERQDGIAAAWRVVDEAVASYVYETHVRRAVPLIARLRAHVDSQKDAELARTLARLEHLSPQDRDVVALLAHRLVNGMFHHLATRLKTAATAPDADTYLRALAFLFDDGGAPS
jgi:glutamyl-tRNA reductase